MTWRRWPRDSGPRKDRGPQYERRRGDANLDRVGRPTGRRLGCVFGEPQTEGAGVRSLEEYGKLVDGEFAPRCEAIRYQLYTLEKVIDSVRAASDWKVFRSVC